jgi:cytochrome c
MHRFAVIAAACLLSVPAAAAAPSPRPAAFSVCATCHVTTQGQKSTIGPNLFGVPDRSSGELAGYAYSPAMKRVGLKWTPENLAAFITAPQMIVPGTKMAFGGLKDPEKVKEVIEYLGSLK